MGNFRKAIEEAVSKFSLVEEDTASDGELVKLFDATKNSPVEVDVKMSKGEFKANHRGKGEYADGTTFVWVYDPESDKFLITQRADDGKWGQSAGGGMIYTDKDFESAAERETEEEIGIAPRNLHKVKIMPRGKDGITMNWLGIFYAEVPGGESMNLSLQAEEVSDAKWLTFDEIMNEYTLVNSFVTESLQTVNNMVHKSV